MEEDGPCDGRRPKKDGWDEYGILNSTTCAESSGESGSGVEWKSFGSGSAASGKEPPGTGCGDSRSFNAATAKEHEADGDGREKHGNISLISSLRESVSRNIRRAAAGNKENQASECAKEKGIYFGIEPNISKQRYYEHMRKSKGVRLEPENEGEAGEVGEVAVESDGKEQGRKTEREENMRRAIRSRESDLRTKDQEIFLLRQKISRLESAMEIKGKGYIETCIERGEAAVRMLQEEMKRERNVLLKRIDEEAEASKMLAKRNEGLKKIINELVRKIKRAKRAAGG